MGRAVGPPPPPRVQKEHAGAPEMFSTRPARSAAPPSCSSAAGSSSSWRRWPPHVLFGTFLAEAAFCIYLGVGGAAGRADHVRHRGAHRGLRVLRARPDPKAGNIISVASNALLSMPSLMCLVSRMLASASLVIVLILVAPPAAMPPSRRIPKKQRESSGSPN